VIQVFQVHKSYGANVALSDINLRIRKGEFVFITGPSGAGKTTLLRLIFGADAPTQGQIIINGINLSRISRSKLDLLRRRIGFVFQDFKLLNSKTVAQNVSLALEVMGEKRSVIRKKTHQALKAVGLSSKEQAFPLQLSGGEQQRVAIARSILNDPLILLADEPTGNLDSSSGREILELFDDVNEQGKTMIVVTHDLSVSRHAHRMIHLRDGRIESDVRQ
jgi:cell division transport system ATP-binding protein